MDKKITMIDSGAFSVWKSGKADIDVRDYGEYLLRVRDSYETCVNLDVIPGAPRRPPSYRKAEAAVDQSWENYHYLKSLGLEPMFIFHQGEEYEALERIIKAGHDYIGISPDDSKSPEDRGKFLDVVFYCITDRNGLPIVKAHGFGVTSVEFMFRYPWFSLDSTTWKATARYGNILIPCRGKDDGFNYTQSPMTLAISEKSSKQYDLGDGFFLKRKGKAWLARFLESENMLLNQVESGTTEGYKARCRINLRVMQRVAQQLPVKPYRESMLGGFVEKFQTDGGLKVGPRKLIFSTEPGPSENALLTEEGVFSRLLSYHKLRRKRNKAYLEEYMSSW